MHKTNVFITVDTEHSIGGAFKDPSLKPVGNDKRIYGRFNGKEYGIPLIMDIADENGLKLTFFVEVLNKFFFGEDETREVCEYILRRGHDVQLHLHPNFLNFREKEPWKRKYADNMHAYTREEQIEILKLGKEIISTYTGHDPVAFRAGNYGADSNTLHALAETGFCIDSSYNRAYNRTSRILVDTDFNDVGKLGDVYEIPITNFIQRWSSGEKKFRPLDINGVGYEEICHVLEYAHRTHMNAVTIVMHSFSFIKAQDTQYVSSSIRNNIIKKYIKLCTYLNKKKDKYQSTIMHDLVKEKYEKNYFYNKTIIPTVPLKYTLKRFSSQAWNEFFM